ncbi:nucleoside hydrolase [Bacillus sp. Bos-x628]|uniref:nucleoside hydrolase n=1 Tax=Bacillus maqinnsis TaxID=3229854 RepID=UPI00338DD414
MKKPVYFNHDGGVEDLAALFLVLQIERIEGIGMFVIPADCYLEPALRTSQKITDRFGSYDIEVAASHSRGVNSFPKEWRMHAFYVDALSILNEKGSVDTKVSKFPAHLHLVESVNKATEPVTLLFTGPFTDLVRAIDEDPSISSIIKNLVWMGGTFLEKRNVEEPEHDGTAEWNAFWDPYAVSTVFQEHFPIEMVALESINQVALTLDVRQHWASLCSHIGIDFIGQCYAFCPPLIHDETNSTYYLWNILTTITLDFSAITRSKEISAIVYTETPKQGRIEEHLNGKLNHVIDHVNRDTFFQAFEKFMRKAVCRITT